MDSEGECTEGAQHATVLLEGHLGLSPGLELIHGG
jgi:hypothetical protein